MSSKLFVGNLSCSTTENALQDLFAAHGEVTSVDLIVDKFSGRPRGFAFVTMAIAVTARTRLASAASWGRPSCISCT